MALGSSGWEPEFQTRALSDIDLMVSSFYSEEPCNVGIIALRQLTLLCPLWQGQFFNELYRQSDLKIFCDRLIHFYHN